MKTFLRFILVALPLPLCPACDELFVTDIGAERIEVLAPAADAVLEDGAVIFSWEALEYAERYRLMLESVSAGTLADTLLAGNRFAVETPLPAGSYRWRIQAFNAEYHTPVRTLSFRVRTARDIGGESPTVLSPRPDSELSSGTATFSWEALPGAERYRLWVVAPAFEQAQRTLVNETLTGTHFEADLPDGDYQWRIQALNAEFSTVPLTFPFRVRATPDIGEAELTVLAPRPGAELSSAEVLFSWESLAGAERYRILVASPDFERAGQLFEDTCTQETAFRMTLPDGEYQWRLQAENGAYRSRVYTGSLRVASAVDLSERSLAVLAPADGVTISERRATFAWEPLAGADHYRLTVVAPAFDRVEQVVADVTAESTSYLCDLPEGEFQWRIQAVNSGSRTTPRIRSLRVSAAADLTDRRVALIAPGEGVSTTHPSQLFAWEPLAGATAYRLMIASPSFAQVEVLVDDRTTEETSLRVDLPPGSCQWRVQAIGGNSRGPWTTRSLTILDEE